MTLALRQFALLVAKDLRIEARSRQTLSLVVIVGLLVVVVLGLGLGANATHAAQAFAATSVLWVAYLFSGVLCFEKTMALDREGGALAGLLLAPLDRGLIYLAKLVGNVVLMLAVAAVVTPAGILFFNFDLSAAPLTFAAVIGLSMVGFAAVGTLFAALVASTRLQSGLLAITVFPIALPLVITSTQMLLRVFRDGQTLDAGALGILAAFDVIFVVTSWLIFEQVLEP